MFPAHSYRWSACVNSRCGQAIALIITICMNRLVGGDEAQAIEFSLLCFLISGGLNIVFGLNTDMIRPQTLWAEKPTQPTRGEDCGLQVQNKNSTYCVSRCSWLFLACVTSLPHRTSLGTAHSYFGEEELGEHLDGSKVTES